MSGLREMLAEHASAVPEVAPSTRVRQVHARIRTARRRRTAGAVTAAVAAVVGGTLAVTLPRDHTPTPADAPTKMVGHAVPRTTTSLGDTYRYVRGYVGKAGRLTVSLPATDTGYLVRMASEDASGQLTLGWRGAPQQWVTGGGAFGSFYEVLPGNPMRLTVRETGVARPHGVALAAYSLASTAPGSVTRGGLSFPPEAAGQPLLGAWIGKPGQGTHTVHVTGTEGRIDIHRICGGLPRGSILRITVSGLKGFYDEGGCTGSPEVRPGEYGGASTVRVSPGAHDIEVSVVDAHGKPVSVPSTAQLGVGVYTSALIDSVHGLPRFVDAAGHRWKLGPTLIGRPGQRTLNTAVQSRRPVVVSYGSTGGLKGRVSIELGDFESDQSTAGGYGSTVVAAGHHFPISLRATGTGPSVRLLVGRYYLAD